MNESEVLTIARDLILTVAILVAPTLLVSMFVGTVFSILQTITSIQEQTLSFAPRMLSVFCVLLVTLPWTLKLITGFAMRMFTIAAGVGG